MPSWRALMFVVTTACGPGPVELSVDLRTDYVPGVEFTGVRVELVDDGLVRETPAGDADYLTGARVAELGALAPETRRSLAVSLLDASDRVVARREVLVRHDVDRVVTVVLTRDCRDVTCPAAEGSAATSCLGGECVDPSCVEGDEETCTPACLVDADCAAMAACAVPRCSSGVCLYGSGDTCPAGEYCDASNGCVPIEPSACAPTLDVTHDLLTGSTDGEGLAARPEDPALTFDGDGAWLAFATISAPDSVNIGTVYAAHIGCDGAFGEPEMLIPDADRPSIALAGDRLLVGCRAMGVFTGSESLRFVDPATGLPLGPALDPDPRGSVEDVVPRGALFDVLATDRIDVEDARLRIYTLDAAGAMVDAVRTPVPESDVAEQESPNGEVAAGGTAVAFLRSRPGSALGIADEVVVHAPFIESVVLDTSSPRQNRTPGLVVFGDVAWVSVHEGPNAAGPDDQLTSLHSVSASGATRHDLPAPPAGAGESSRALVEGPPGEMLHVFVRLHDTEPSELMVRRLDVDGETLSVGPERVVPTEDSAGAVAGVHVGGGSYLIVWSEARPPRSATLRARFVRP